MVKLEDVQPADGPIYFESQDAFRHWLEVHHGGATECIVGFWKVGTGEPSLTWSEAVDEALCWGSIDSRGKRIDERRHSLRFTPRRLR